MPRSGPNVESETLFMLSFGFSPAPAQFHARSGYCQWSYTTPYSRGSTALLEAGDSPTCDSRLPFESLTLRSPQLFGVVPDHGLWCHRTSSRSALCHGNVCGVTIVATAFNNCRP